MSLKNHAKPEAPKGWEKSIIWDGTKGEISTGPLADEPTDDLWNEIVKDFGIGDNLRIIPGSIQIRAWDSYAGRMKYYRARLEPSTATEESRVDVEELCRIIERRRPLVRGDDSQHGGDRALVVCLADWQIGKGEGGGTPAFVERLLETFDRLEAHAKVLHKRGISQVYIVGLGDVIEGCSGFYAMQEWQTDLDRREQMKLARRMILDLVERFIKLKYQIVLGAVPGNHGENRKNGKAFTTWTDNDDLAVFEQVAEILSHNAERYADVSVPSGAIADDLTMTLDICGVDVGFAHGHQARAGQLPTWWLRQAHGKQSIGHADILVTGHYHHLVCSESSGRTWLQCPAMDGGSKWFTNTTGASAPPGMLTFVAGQGCGDRGWEGLEIL